MNKLLFLLPTLAALGASPAWSQAAPAHDHTHAQAKADTAGPATDGEVRKVDKANGKVTIKHGEIKALNMPPMTMVYPVTDGAMLDKVKVGDKVKFTATNDGGKLTVTGIQPAK
ncbi:MAG: copper-binding protein [Ramlibacter sp.]|nr:copper-binding protein [Ramlibacter sp.]